MRPYRSLLAVLFICSVASAHAQSEALRPLTLREAVLQPGRFSAQRIPGLSWVPGTHHYTYLREGDLMRGSVNGTPDTVIASVGDLQAAMPQGEALQRFPPVEWIDAEQALVVLGDAQVLLNVRTRSTTLYIPTPASAEHAEWDPGYKHLAYTENGNLIVRVRQPDDLLPITTDAEDGLVYGSSVHRDEYGVHKGTFWSPDGNKLAYYRLDERMVSPYNVEDITSAPSTFRRFRYPMAGDTSHQVSVHVFDLRTMRSVRLQTTSAPDDYLTNISWDAAGQEVQVIHLDRAGNHLRVVSYDAGTGMPVRTLLEERSNTWLEPQEPLHYLSTKPGQYLYLGSGDGWQHVYLRDTRKGLVRQLTKGNWEVSSVLGLDPKEEWLYVEGSAVQTPNDASGALEQHIYRVKLSNGSVTRLTRNAGTHRGQLSSDARYLIDSWSSSTEPGRIELIDAQNGAVVKTLATTPDRYAGYAVGTVEYFQVPGELGDPLNARLIKPRNFDAGNKYPLLVYVYGGPHAQMVSNTTAWGASPWMLEAAERGYLVLTVDGHGTPKRGRRFEQAIHRQLGITEVKDQLRAVDHVLQWPWVDSTRIGVHGWSFGGHMTVAMMLRAPDRIAVGVAGGPVMDWGLYEVMYTERYMDTPAENPDGYAATRLSDKCAELKGDLLVVHGLLDDVVLPQHSYRFLKDCVSREEQVEFFVYPGHPHNVRGKDRLHLMEKVLDRMDRSLLRNNGKN